MLSMTRARPSRAVPRVDLTMDEALHHIDEFGTDARLPAGVHDVAEVGELEALLAGHRVVTAVDHLRVLV